MQSNQRVYPAQKHPGVFFNWLMLAAAAWLAITGLLPSASDGMFGISSFPKPAPAVLDEAFDETSSQMQMELPKVTWYALQLGAFENEDSAKQLADGFKNRGAAGFVWHDGRYRTLAAVYPSRDDALSVREQLGEKHFVETYLYEIALPDIRFEMHGMQGQLEILSAAFGHAADTLNLLQKTSIQMDQHELNVTGAGHLLSSAANQINIVAARIRQRFAVPRHATVEAVLTLLDDFSAFAAQDFSSDTQVTLAQKLKYQTLQTLYQLQQTYETLNHT